MYSYPGSAGTLQAMPQAAQRYARLAAPFTKSSDGLSSLNSCMDQEVLCVLRACGRC